MPTRELPPHVVRLTTEAYVALVEALEPEDRLVPRDAVRPTLLLFALSGRRVYVEELE